MASRTSTPNTSRRGSVATPTAGGAGADVSGNQPKKFLNGWTKEQERLMAEWADVAGCYRWLHDRSEKVFSRSNMWITIPVIVLSTLTGTANFAVDSFIPEGDQDMKKYVGAGIGGISIFAGILTTLGNFFQYAQKSEGHKVAGIAWGKFQRQVAVELAIHPDERIDAMDFLKICRQDLDRLIEQSPPVPDAVIKAFEVEFKDVKDLKVPDICHGIEHTRVYDASKPRLGKITAEAALYLKQRKKLLKDDLFPDLEKQIKLELEGRIEQRIRTLMPPVSPPAPTTPPTEPHTQEEELRDAIIHLEQDWRKLLVGRKHILHAAPAATQSSPPSSSASVRGSEANEIVINVVGSDGPAGPPSEQPQQAQPPPLESFSPTVNFA